MKIVNVTSYEIGNGIQIDAVVNNIEYSLYAQLPDCPDSQHSFLNSESKDHDLMRDIIEEATKNMSNLDQIALTELGTTDYSYDSYDDYYVLVDNQDEDNYRYMHKNSYSDYYNTLLLVKISDDSDECECKEVINNLRVLKQVLTS